jgi:hypothetical protein
MEKEKMIHYGLIEEAIQRRYEITNRKERRPAEKEYQRIVEIIYGVEYNFHLNLFQAEETSHTYKDIYEFYHNQYNNNVMYIITKIKPKFWSLDKAAFSRKFRPLT